MEINRELLYDFLVRSLYPVNLKNLSLSNKNLFSKCEPIRSSLRISLQLLNKFLTKNLIFLCSESAVELIKSLKSVHKVLVTIECLENVCQCFLVNVSFSTSNFNEVLYMNLIHFHPMFHFYTPWKHQKTVGLLIFAGGIEVKHWLKMG